MVREHVSGWIDVEQRQAAAAVVVTEADGDQFGMIMDSQVMSSQSSNPELIAIEISRLRNALRHLQRSQMDLQEALNEEGEGRKSLG